MLNWKELSSKIGSLPRLQFLRLGRNACRGPEWETVEGQFCSLKFLLIYDTSSDLRYWRTDNTHFPRLEKLQLRNLKLLEEIPLSMGDIPTLKYIRLEDCSKSADDSARSIKEEQLDNGNEDLHVLCASPQYFCDLRKRKEVEMAAYAALLSLMHTLHQINIHPCPPISLDPKQVDCLTQNLTFLQNFLEHYYSSSSSEEDDDLNSRITGAAYAAEDVIESHIVDRIHAGSNISTVDLYQDLERAIGDMDLIRIEVMEIIKENNMGAQHQDQLHTNSTAPSASTRPASTGQSSAMVGFDDVLLTEVLDKLTGQPCNIRIIPIVGMGGIGKTTLARYIYSNPLIIQHFDILAWVTLSQEYSRREILQVLCHEIRGSNNDLSRMSEDELGETLHKHLWGRRYLIVMDDIWSIEAWDKVNYFFPNNNNGSRIMITTRLSNLAFQLSGTHGLQMNFLEDDKSWDLLCEIVFGKGLGCPIELENIGKEIARNCRGLPLSIVVIGGLLTKSNMRRAYWEYTLQNLNSLINMENNEHCLQILLTSYKELPMHLKPCFLYMGIFPEDHEIRVPDLIKLWVAEGILRPIDGKTLEEVAEVYVKELIDRNLVLVRKLWWNGEPKVCKIHDLLRDLCLREAQKQRFLCILSQQDRRLNIPWGINTGRRICISKDRPGEFSPQILGALKSASLTRSFFYRRITSVDFDDHLIEYSPSTYFGLLRVYYEAGTYIRSVMYSENFILQQLNLRYLSLGIYKLDQIWRFTSLCFLLWNLQTLKVVLPRSTREPIIAPSEIWERPLLRHVRFVGLELPDPPSGEEDNFVLVNLQTLSGIVNLKCSEEVVKRIPNIKKLKFYHELDDEDRFPNLCLQNLDHLKKLETFHLWLLGNADQEELRSHVVRNITFPHSLKKLTLWGTRLHWEELTTKIGSLPLLQYLRLDWDACIGPVWETVEGQFCSLKFLRINDESGHLRYWRTDGTHFPRLEQLQLHDLNYLEDIPSSIGDIPTLKYIRLEYCSKSVEDSAQRIKEEQLDNGNEDFRVHIGQWE